MYSYRRRDLLPIQLDNEIESHEIAIVFWGHAESCPGCNIPLEKEARIRALYEPIVGKEYIGKKKGR